MRALTLPLTQFLRHESISILRDRKPGQIGTHRSVPATLHEVPLHSCLGNMLDISVYKF